MNKKNKELIKIGLIVLVIIVLSNLFDFRTCLIYNIFHIPCPGCGATRASALLLKLDIKESLSYSIIPLLFIIFLIIIMIWSLIDYKQKKESLKNFYNKHKKLLIVLAVILTIIIWIINLNNPLLY